jgi:hypothetical protein
LGLTCLVVEISAITFFAVFGLIVAALCGWQGGTASTDVRCSQWHAIQPCGALCDIGSATPAAEVGFASFEIALSTWRS